MTFNQFYSRALSVLILLIGVVVGWHVKTDIYGLWHFGRTESKVVYHNERLSKYLMAHAYIPRQFDALLIGPSFSANVATQEWEAHDGTRLYNGSIIGGNMLEINVLAKAVMRHDTHKRIKRIIICLDPYLFNSRKRKTGYMIPANRWGSLGSLDSFHALKRRWQIQQGKRPQQWNAHGVYDNKKQGHDLAALIEKMPTADASGLFIDTHAKWNLKNLINVAQQNGVDVIVYFHPVSQAYLDKSLPYYHALKDALTPMLSSKNVSVINGYGEAFRGFRQDLSHYEDISHLNAKGANVFSRELQVAVNALSSTTQPSAQKSQ